MVGIVVGIVVVLGELVGGVVMDRSSGDCW